uniref:Uncharacterized protein n=1 Tax=Meloidogyne enterolobii TaxID=390850 RepID=A0A6V7UPM6_MELEN|nr:unnamed protein product [Meloidogyne enterolobii]
MSYNYIILFFRFSNFSIFSGSNRFLKLLQFGQPLKTNVHFHLTLLEAIIFRKQIC